jgi:hypothetical protein
VSALLREDTLEERVLAASTLQGSQTILGDIIFSEWMFVSKAAK